MKRKGMGKGQGKGYKNMVGKDPMVHSQSAKGMKQPQGMPKMKPPKDPYSDEDKEFIESFGLDTFKSFIKETDSKIESINFEEGMSTPTNIIVRVEMDDGSEYVVFEDEDTAEAEAKERVREDLENEPELFNQDWLSNYLTMSDTDRNIIAGEEAEAFYNNMNDEDLIEEAGFNIEFEEIQEKIDEAEETESEYKEDRDRFENDLEYLERKKEDLIDKAREDLIEAKTDEIRESLKDPIDYFVEEQGMYSREDLLKQSFISIDYDEAVDDAIATDGWQHFLASYDGNSIDLDGGRVAVRVN